MIENDQWNEAAHQQTFVHKLTGALYRLIGYRRTVELGKNYDNTHSSLPPQMRLEAQDGSIIETHPENNNFYIEP